MGAFRFSRYNRAKVNLFGFGGMNGEKSEKTAPASQAELSFNFACQDGALSDGVGLKEFSYPLGDLTVVPSLPVGTVPLKTYYYKRYDYETESSDDRLLVYAGDGKIYESRTSAAEPIMSAVAGLDFASAPDAVSYKLSGDDVIIFSGGGLMKIYDGSSVTLVEGVPEVTSMCMHNERLFVTTGGEQTSLWFSDDFDPTDFYVSLDEAGFIDFQDGRGRLLKAVSFNNYVYVFRNYGISRVYAYGDQKEFSVQGLYLGSGRIYKNAIVECGNRIIYLAEDGFYSFDGLYSSRIITSLDKYLSGVDNDDAVGRYYNGKLYMALNMRLDKKISRVLVVYDGKSGGVYVSKGLRVRDVCTVAANGFSALVFVCDNTPKLGTLTNSARAFNRPLKKLWRSNFTDFGIASEKFLDKITLYASKNITLTVKSDEGSVRTAIRGGNRLQSVSVGLRGTAFSVEIKAETPSTVVEKAALHFNYYG